MKIGDRIRRARLAAGMTQRELAAAVGLSNGIVGLWESHRRQPGRDNMLKIAEATMVSPDELLRDFDNTHFGLLVTDLRQIALLRRFAQMSPRQQENLLELFGVAGDVRRELQEERHPAEGRLASVKAANS